MSTVSKGVGGLQAWKDEASEASKAGQLAGDSTCCPLAPPSLPHLPLTCQPPPNTEGVLKQKEC